MKRLSVCAILLLTSACTHVDTGQTDYRLADKPASLTDGTMKILPGNRCTEETTAQCDPMLPARVVRRYMPDNTKGWEAIRKDQVYSIEIEQGMIGDNILEGKFLGKQYGTTAEIAVLANVFEFAGDTSGASSQRFLEAGEFAGKADDPSDVELKLIYFGDDVKRHQALNFSNIPLRSRTAYGGGSIGIQLVVMEVDAQAGPVASLLKTLARFGQQALPGPGEAKDILFDLGESLLSGSNDDKLLEYRFVLSAGGEDPRAPQATFAPGRYVVRRMQKRDVDMNWGSLRLDHNTGRLFRQDVSPTGDGAFKEVRDDLYMVVNVRSYPEGTKPEFYAQKDWSTFRDALQVAADTKAAPLDKVTERLVGVLENGRSTEWRDNLLLKWAAVASRLDVYSIRHAADFSSVPLTGCPVTTRDLRLRSDMAEREVRDAIRLYRANYQSALAAKRKDKAGAVVGDEFKADERERVVSTAATYFMPWSASGASQAAFADAASFEKAYIDAASTGDLIKDALAAAISKAADNPTCAALLAR